MKEVNIKNTKKSLSTVFSMIVFVVVFVLGMFYFSAKYVREMRIEKNNFHIFIDVVGKGGIYLDTITFKPTIEFRNEVGRERGIKITSTNTTGRNFIGFINYILLDDNKIVINNIRDNIPEELILYSLESNLYNKEYQKSSFLVKKEKLKDGKILIAYKKLEYSFTDYLSDILGFSLVLLLFTIVVYFIGSKFVNKIFIPVEENLKDMNDFIHNAGHELKTPLSVIDSDIQMMKESKIYDENMIDELKNEVIKLNSLINSLVELSDIDVFKDLEELNLKNCIDEVVNDFKANIKKKKLAVNIEIEEDIFIKSNKNYFYIFLSNIIGNAIKYNKKEGSIDVEFKAENGKLKDLKGQRKGILTIKDSGIGIKANEIEKIFDRFYKSDVSRNSQGFGIGLSLVKKIANIYKWKIDVESKEGKGTNFKIKF